MKPLKGESVTELEIKHCVCEKTIYNPSQKTKTYGHKGFFWYLILYYWISRDIPSATDVDVYTILHCDLTYWFRLSNIN
ncbi:hypothetical protein Avbf_14765 [Armadillidium vulgare]|nr:hypothetical protein Avbf_14765 [Armadillidium vulgare]